ncbi:conserved membrane-spanning protein [Beutenbergia cavernae DSM 12333]|uniref:Conserved membrane-spanning protein n=1 Tax=Beutenbergia cavernae (strain ATCC BAA-8 / DSM 12333 / CCUG 43141 / JCM 11478 / NBRC 16432 / NCIMB 13614 / HKI 0122) TaxID=471853 RepID=C5C5N9_BEUC1|nr:alpha/beta hydrolase [Beutenbergia cavernae]ACQ80230.1 conserved membrane-spanning protein [Beutenbergia cavernae DSM 12333]
MPALSAVARALTRLGRSFSLPGLAGALLAFVASTAPSLVPRGAVYQTVISGACAVLGYAAGVALWWLLTALRLPWRPGAAARRRARWSIAVAAVVLVPAGLVIGAGAQRELARLWGLDATPSPQYVLVVVGGAVLALLLLGIARGVRGTARALGRLLGRWLPHGVAAWVGAAVAVVVLVGLVSGVVQPLLLAPIEASFRTRDTTTRAGVEQPEEPERSGSPSSLEEWDTLGYEGRIFVAGGPGADGIAEYTGGDALEPIRVYAGVAGSATASDAPTDRLADAAARVVAELDRTDAWSREALALVTTTGTGWVDPAAVTALELLHAGDTAVAALQYSTNPSWVTLVADRAVPELAGQALLDAVTTRWAELPEDERPRLLLFGESLGAFGSQGPFRTLDDVADRVDGAVWVGTPRFTPLWTRLTGSRDAGSPEIHPVLDDGAFVRWATRNDGDQGLTSLGEDWGDPRVVYVQHPSDGVVWWDFDAVWRRPDWLAEPPGQDVLPGLVWIPGITFLQLTGDMFLAGSPDVPMEFGHRYREAYADAWAAVAPPDGWTDADTTRLREHLAGDS